MMNRVINLVKLYFDYTKKPPCKKTIQKINYLIQEAENNFLYDYSIHFYGPYSAELDLDMQYLHKCGDLEITYSNLGHLLTVKNFDFEMEIDEVGEGMVHYFSSQSPSQLELLATTLYVQREIKSTDINTIMGGVVKIKGSKYNEDKISAAILELMDLNYF